MSEEVKKQQLLDYLNEKMFDYNLSLAKSTNNSRMISDLNYVLMILRNNNSFGIVSYVWSAIQGTEKSIRFSDKMKEQGYIRFEDIFEDFRVKFGNKFLEA